MVRLWKSRAGTLLLCLALLQLAAFAGDNGEPVGPVTVELLDRTTVSGVLIEANELRLIIRTRDGERKIERKNIKAIKPGLASKGDGDDELRIDRAANTAVVDDMPDPPARKTAANAEKKNADGAGDKVLDAIKKSTARPLSDQAPPATPAKTAAHDGPADKQWERGFTQIDVGDYKGAVQFFRATIVSGNSDELNKAEAQARQKFSRSLAEIMVMCYATVKCPDCNGDGVLQCTDCNGTGYLTKNLASSAPAVGGGLKNVNTGSNRARVALCQKCHGNGFDVCMHCLGTGIGFVEPTSYEREAYTAYFQRLAAEALGSSEVSYGDTGRESMPSTFGGSDKSEANLDSTIKQVWLRDSADRAKSDVMRLWRAEGFYRLALKSDPSLMIRSTKDLNQELIKIKIRRQNLYAELSERLRFKDLKGDE